MKVCLFTDNHWSEHSSIITSNGEKYSTRLENQIKSLNWVEDLAKKQGCCSVFCLGDFFNNSVLKAQEISALKEISWNGLDHIFLVGNHEMGTNDLTYNSAEVFKLIPNARVISFPTTYTFGDVEFCLLPYVLESNRKTLAEYFGYTSKSKRRVILSHNDIAGVQMGQFKSVNGFDINDIKANCELFLNGHLHNGGKIDEGIYNIGSLTGQNFTEDATVYDHVAFILDIETLDFTVWLNPHAFNFYKLEYTGVEDFKLKANPVVTCKTTPELVQEVREKLNSLGAISRILVTRTLSESAGNLEDLAVDHLEKFKEFILEKLGASDDVISEIEEIIK